MDTKDPRPSPQGLVSQGDGLWMKMDSSTVTDHTETHSATSGAMLRDETKVTLPTHTVITSHYSVMDDEGADEVFIPPQLPAPLLPAEGSTGVEVSNSSVTLSNEDKTNPSSLDRHDGVRKLMAAQTKVVEVRVSATETSKESMDTKSLSNDKDPTPPTDQDQTSTGTGCLMETSRNSSGRGHQDNTRRDKESKEIPSNITEHSENESHFDREADKTKSVVTERDSKLENVNCDSVGTKDGYSQYETDSSTNQPQVLKTPVGVTNDDQEHVDTRSFNYNLTKKDWVRRESGSSETQVPRRRISDCSEETMTKGDHGDGNRRLSNDIQQGEQLLQRLQLVQQRQDVHMPEGLSASQVAKETRREGKSVFQREADEGEGAKTNLMEKEKNEINESKERFDRPDSDDELNDRWVPGLGSPINPHETTQTPSLSGQHRLSVDETSINRQIQEATQGKQNLQRAGGTLYLAGNPDVLEIPFKTNISLEPPPHKVGQGEHSDRQFSEQKMQKEISQEIQREMVLVNQGKIRGGYSKGEIRQLKETKLLFEVFHQDNTEGPTRNRKLPATLIRGHVYPSVLERTRSLEMLSLKSCPISRAHSFRLYESATSERDKNPETLRSRSPTGGSRDKTRLSPYPKQDTKHMRMYRSMDSINTDVATSAVEGRSKSRDRNTRHGSTILQENPFFKLRPALALQPEVEKDIREAREREEELRRQRCTLYGENRQMSQEEEKSRSTNTLAPDVRQQSRGKLERVWPPPSKTDQLKSEQTQEPKVHRAGGQKAPLWQRWESGLINGQPSKENN